MPIGTKRASALVLTAIAAIAPALVNHANAGAARQEGLLLTATEVLEDVQGMPDQRLPDALLARAYGIAVIPDVHEDRLHIRRPSRQRRAGGAGQADVPLEQPGVRLAHRRQLGLSDRRAIVGYHPGLHDQGRHRRRRRRQGDAGRGCLGSRRAGRAARVGRDGRLACRDLFLREQRAACSAGIASDGSVLGIDRSANAALYQKSGVTASEIFSGQAPAPPETAQRFLDQLAQMTHTAVRGAPAPQADVPAPAAAGPAAAPAPPTGEAPRTYPLETQK